MSLARKGKVNLPKDWIVVNSTSFPDRVYYFNVRTAESSWTEPLNEPNKPVKPSLKRKASPQNDQDEFLHEKICSPSPEAAAKQPQRKMLRAKRPSEPQKAQETPQMKEMRRKMLEKKQSKVAQSQKPKSRGLIPEKCKEEARLVAGKRNRGGKSIPQRRNSKQQIRDDATKSVNKVAGTSSSGEASGSRAQRSSTSCSSREASGSRSQRSSTSCSQSTSTTSSNVTKKNPRLEAGQRKDRIDSSKSSSTASGSSTLKKNLASKRMDTLKKNLNIERKKIEPIITAKMARRMLFQNTDDEAGKSDTSFDPNAKNKLKRTKSPIEELPGISQNVDCRFKTLRAKLSTNSPPLSARINEENKQSDIVAPRAPKVVKPIKKPVKRVGKAGATNAGAVLPSCEEPRTSHDHSAAENQCRDSFWEEMEWEPIEEEKVVVEIQEVRSQLSTDQATQPKLPDCTRKGLELSQVSRNTDKRILYIVVDTNVYLSNLKTVTELIEDSGKYNGYYRPVVVVPWTVLQELDYIKDNKSRTKSAQLQRSAKTAVDLLFKYFSSKHPRLKGQTAADAASNRMKFQVESPDDEILQSCLQIRELGYTVVLLSNDKNLCTKAMINNISTYGRHESIQEMLLQNKGEVGSIPSKEPLKIIENQAETEDSKEAEISDDIFCEAKAIIKHFLSTIVSKEMENLYGENWKKYTIVQPPWSVTDVLKCTSKHWIAAISDVFVKQAEFLVAKLSKMFLDAPKYGQSLRYVSEVLDVCYDLVQMVKSKDHQELAEKTSYDVKELMNTCKNKLKELHGNRNQALIEHENNNLNDEQRANNAFRYFEQIWMFTNNFCGLTADLMGIPHSITYKSFDPPMPAETINRIQPELVFGLNQLIHALRTVLNDDEFLTPDHPALIALYQSLVNYFPNSEEFHDLKSLDIVDLLYCVKVKKEFLRTGLVQLQELCCQFCRIADFRSTATTTITN